MKKLPRKDQRRTNKPGRGSPNRVSPREDRRRPRFSRELSILYEDDAVVIVDKPPGLMAVPVRGLNTPSALSLLVVSLQTRKQQALIVHRIDRFASGALLFAKTSRDRNSLVQQFLAHTPVRKYLAVVRGRLEVEAGTLIHHFRKDGMMQQLRTAKDPKAARAELRYSVERRFTNASLVRVELETGLQNQIRAQFAAMGHPVIGDRKYHPAECSEPLIARVALHAAHLTFVHPRTGKNISIDCKPPADFQYLVRELSRAKPPAGRAREEKRDRKNDRSH
jgi:23S rRNA pseudouridine1911/1915/1917 synthase